MAIDRTMRGFSQRIAQIGAAVEVNANKTLRKTVITVASSVVLATPVREGRARANWVTRINKPPEGEVTDFNKGGAASQAINQSVSEMGLLRGVAAGDVFIGNNLPYIQRLNGGWSQQAPSGFVQTAISAGIEAIRKARLVG